jgi:hypothetical protein
MSHLSSKSMATPFRSKNVDWHLSTSDETENSRFSVQGALQFIVTIAILLACTQIRPFSELPFFWLALSAPLWFPTFALPGREHTHFLRRMTSVLAIAWYLTLITVRGEGTWLFSLQPLPHDLPHEVMVTTYVVTGTIASLAVLAYSARGWRHLVNIPLWIAIIAGSVSVLVN